MMTFRAMESSKCNLRPFVGMSNRTEAEMCVTQQQPHETWHVTSKSFEIWKNFIIADVIYWTDVSAIKCGNRVESCARRVHDFRSSVDSSAKQMENHEKGNKILSRVVYNTKVQGGISCLSWLKSSRISCVLYVLLMCWWLWGKEQALKLH